MHCNVILWSDNGAHMTGQMRTCLPRARLNTSGVVIFHWCSSSWRTVSFHQASPSPTPFQGRPYYWNLAVSLYLGMPGFSELIRSSSPTSPRVWALAALWILIPKLWCCSLRTATFPVSLGLSHTLWPYAPRAGTLFQTLNSWCLSCSNWTMCVITLKNIPEGKLGFNLWPKSRIRNWFVPSKNKTTNEWMDPTENTSDYMKFHACLLSVSLKCFKTSFLSSKEVCPRNKINWLQTLVVTTVPSALPSLCSGP